MVQGGFSVREGLRNGGLRGKEVSRGCSRGRRPPLPARLLYRGVRASGVVLLTFFFLPRARRS